MCSKISAVDDHGEGNDDGNSPVMIVMMTKWTSGVLKVKTIDISRGQWQWKLSVLRCLRGDIFLLLQNFCSTTELGEDLQSR